MLSRTSRTLLVLGCLAATACEELDLTSKGPYCLHPVYDPPVVALIDPQDGDTVGQDPLFVAEARDDQSPPEALTVEWIVSGESVCPSSVVDAGGRTQCTPSLETGPNDIYVRVTNEYGLSDVDEANIIVENDDPEAYIVDPADGATVSLGFTLTAEARDSRSPSDALEVAWTVDMMRVCTDSTLDDDGIATCTPELTEGRHTITFSATDEDYGSTHDTITVVLGPT